MLIFNYRLLLSLLDHFKEEAGLDSDVVPSTTSPAQRKPMLKHSGNGGSDVYEMVYCNVCVTGCMCVYVCVLCMLVCLCFSIIYNNILTIRGLYW